VNLIATDQDEELAPYLKQYAQSLRPSASTSSDRRPH
jgi:hypothetical protein